MRGSPVQVVVKLGKRQKKMESGNGKKGQNLFLFISLQPKLHTECVMCSLGNSQFG